MSIYRFARDPFARTERIRVLVTCQPIFCHWCGISKRRLFKYGIETDGGTKHWDNKEFCNVKCRDSFYGG
jgi:hypothetical protein